MKPIERQNSKELDIQDGDEIVAMTIDPEAMAHVMQVLTNLYKDSQLAVIREYSTNAWDAHIEAEDEFTPIEVTIPTASDPFFRVRDYGLGLDADDINDIYSRYGNSTKRGSNDVVGMLGMGCKSALAYTNEFFVNSVKDGIRISVNVFLDNGIGKMNIVSRTRTNERSGTEVAVPVDKEYWHWEEKINRFFSFWPEASVKIKKYGEPTRNAERIDGMWLNGTTILSHDVSENTIVMGNVPYPAGSPDWNTAAWVKFVEIGDVEFAPSREALMQTEHTNAALRKIKQEVTVLRNKMLAEKINAAKNGYKAIQVYMDVKRYGFKDTPYWNGEPIPGEFALAGDVSSEYTYIHRVKQNRQRRWMRVTTTSMTLLSESVIFVGYKGKTISPAQEDKLNLWMKNKEEAGKAIPAEVKRFLLLDELLPEHKKWIDPSRIYDWDEVKKTALPKAPGEKREQAIAKFEGMSNDGWFHEQSTEDLKDENLFYITKAAQKEGESFDSRLMNYHYKEWTVITVGANQVARLQREFPNIKNIVPLKAELGRKWVNSLSDADVTYLKLQEIRGIEKYARLEADKVNDPALKKLIVAASHKNKKLENAHAIHRYMPLRAVEVRYEDLIVKYYPLANAPLSGYSGPAKDALEHIYFYINAAYAKRIEKDPSNGV